jgi:CRISPR-associated protein Csb2
MLALSFTFPGGRYHATPWGRHVNEADLEWPPSPWRIVRALIAVWHRKLDHERRNIALLERLLGKFAGQAPHYKVPDAVHAHTRHYMPGRGDKKTLIFDAFARLDANAAVTAVWHGVELDSEETTLLDELLAGLGFLGRAESWADATRLAEWSGECNCMPGDEAMDTTTGEVRERVSLYMPMPPADYDLFQSAQKEGISKRADLKPRERKTIEATLPDSWLAAVSLDTSELRAAGWSAPPAARRVSYVRPAGLLRPVAQVRKHTRQQPPITTLRFAMYGKPLPRIEDAVRVGEWLRMAAMSCVKRECGENAIPAVISGHGLGAGNRHEHAFWLPEDADGDGRIDHLLMHIPARVAGAERQALESLHKIWNKDGNEWQLVLEGQGEALGFADHSPLCRAGRVFVSATPYLHPWHIKKGFGVAEQIRRECHERGWQEPSVVESLPSLRIAGRERLALHFHRFRGKRGLTQPDRRGAFVRLEFAEPVQGPLALGFGCHFGLGMFIPLTTGIQ